MESVKKQRICIKFCFKVRETAAETHDMLPEVYDDDPCFASPQESKTGALVDESNIASFFFSIAALRIMNSLLKVRQSRFLSGSSETSVGCGTKKAT
jgi:hypothetical protein